MMRPWGRWTVAAIVFAAGCVPDCLTRKTEYYCDQQEDCETGVCNVNQHVCHTPIDGATDDGAIGDGAPPCESLIAWQRVQVDGGPQDLEIWSSEIDGANARPLTNNDFDEGAPQWSPSGVRIAYTRQDSVWTMNADGTDQRALTSGIDSHPRWSPDGTKLAYIHSDGSMKAIWILLADGTEPRPLINAEPDDPFFDWSPDGTKLAFRTKRDGNFEVYSVNADGSAPTNLSNNLAADGGDGEGDVRWAPDGSAIAFVSDRLAGYPDLWSMSSSGGAAQDLNAVSAGLTLAGFDWSPDSSSIAFARFGAGNVGELHRMNADGSGEHAISDPVDPAKTDLGPSHSMDGAKITWTRLIVEGTFKFEVYVANADGSDSVRISNSPGRDSGPSIRPCP